MLCNSETTCRRFAVTFVQRANEVLQRYARNLRAPRLNCAQDDKRIKKSFQ